MKELSITCVLCKKTNLESQGKYVEYGLYWWCNECYAKETMTLSEMSLRIKHLLQANVRLRTALKTLINEVQYVIDYGDSSEHLQEPVNKAKGSLESYALKDNDIVDST